MSLFYLFAATEMEARALRHIPSLAQTRACKTGKITGTIGPNRVVLFITGIGPEAARAAAIDAMNKLPGKTANDKLTVFVIGTCGSLSPQLTEGEIVVYNACLSAAAAGAESQENLKVEILAQHVQGITKALASGGIRYEIATGITAHRVALRPDKLRLAARGARVVDMESYEIIATAQTVGIPCAVLRVISDSLDREVPDFTPAIRPDGRIEPLIAARIALHAPISTIRFMAANRRAIEKLRFALEAILVMDCFNQT